jgi:pyruvate dehydrogenase E2 component (dihydrolipoamide acetyltransferase)
MDALLALREKENAACPEDRVSVNDCFIKACAGALVAHPVLNSQFVDGETRRYHDADISVVVGLDGGVATPVVRRANRKTVREIAAEVRSLRTRATAGKLRMDEIAGGSFSISNLGAFGVDQFDAIINAPQCAILAVGSASPRAVLSEKGEPRVASVLRATLSVDHRVIDGIAAATFLATVRSALEAAQPIFNSEAPSLRSC